MYLLPAGNDTVPNLLKTYSLLVLSAARKDNQELVHQDGTSMPGAAAPGKYPVNIAAWRMYAL